MPRISRARKREGILAPYVPEEVAKHYPPEHKDADGLFASYRVYLCVMGRNTDLVKAEDAPKGFHDLLDPKWAEGSRHPATATSVASATRSAMSSTTTKPSPAADRCSFQFASTRPKSSPTAIRDDVGRVPAVQRRVRRGLRSAHALVKDKAGRKPMKEIKIMKDDAAAVEKNSEEIKAHYTRLFKV